MQTTRDMLQAERYIAPEIKAAQAAAAAAEEARLKAAAADDTSARALRHEPTCSPGCLVRQQELLP